jgi:hypothetical protein
LSNKCQAKVYGDWHSWQCTRKAKRDGFCTQHHPDTVAKRAAKRRARWDAEDEARRQRTARNEAHQAVFDAAVGVVDTVDAIGQEEAVGDLRDAVEKWRGLAAKCS